MARSVETINSLQGAGGTPLYMSLECGALGAVFYEILAGVPPFSNDEPKPLRQVRPGLPVALDTRLNRMVALKFLPPQLQHDQELKRRLTEEARAASEGSQDGAAADNAGLFESQARHG